MPMVGKSDYRSIRQEFKLVGKDCPLLQKQVYGKPLVYLDNAAMTQMPRQVVEAMVDFYFNFNSNVHRGIHYLSEEATNAYERARAEVASFLSAPRAECIIFTRNTTEGLNLVAYSWARKKLKKGDEILLSIMEHHSNLVPWQQIAKEVGAELVYVHLTSEGLLDMAEFERKLTERVKLVAITHMSNVLGTIVPLSEVVRMAHSVGAIVVADGAQAAAHIPVNLTELDVDFYAVSGYKMLGPTGIGALYGRAELLDEMEPFNFGGSMISHVGKHESRWAEIPQKFEAGTPNIGGAIGFSVALNYLKKFGMEKLKRREQELIKYAFEKLSEVAGLRILGPPPEHRGGIISFVMEGIHAHDLVTVLDQEGIAVRAGHHCAEPLHDYLGISASTRASFYLYNMEYDVDALVKALNIARKVFGYVSA